MITIVKDRKRSNNQTISTGKKRSSKSRLSKLVPFQIANRKSLTISTGKISRQQVEITTSISNLSKFFCLVAF